MLPLTVSLCCSNFFTVPSRRPLQTRAHGTETTWVRDVGAEAANSSLKTSMRGEDYE